MSALPGGRLWAKEAAPEPNQEGKVHCQKEICEQSKPHLLQLFVEYEAQGSPQIEDCLGYERGSVKRASEKKHIAGQHGNEEKREQPSQEFVRQKGKSGEAAQGGKLNPAQRPKTPHR